MDKNFVEKSGSLKLKDSWGPTTGSGARNEIIICYLITSMPPDDKNKWSSSTFSFLCLYCPNSKLSNFRFKLNFIRLFFFCFGKPSTLNWQFSCLKSFLFEIFFSNLFIVKREQFPSWQSHRSDIGKKSKKSFFSIGVSVKRGFSPKWGGQLFNM